MKWLTIAFCYSTQFVCWIVIDNWVRMLFVKPFLTMNFVLVNAHKPNLEYHELILMWSDYVIEYNWVEIKVILRHSSILFIIQISDTLIRIVQFQKWANPLKPDPNMKNNKVPAPMVITCTWSDIHMIAAVLCQLSYGNWYNFCFGH